MTPEDLLSRLKKEIEKTPYLGEMSVIRMAVKDLEAGAPVSTALFRIRIDLDKIWNFDFGRELQEMIRCVEAAEQIREANKTANEGRGSGTAEILCGFLDKLDMEGARAFHEYDGDKLRQYPKLDAAVMGSAVGCRTHHRPFYCPICVQLIRKTG